MKSCGVGFYYDFMPGVLKENWFFILNTRLLNTRGTLLFQEHLLDVWVVFISRLRKNLSLDLWWVHSLNFCVNLTFLSLNLLSLVFILSLRGFISLLLTRRSTLSYNIIRNSLNRMSLTMKNSLLSWSILKDCGCWCSSWTVLDSRRHTTMRFSWNISTGNCLRRIYTSIYPMNWATIHAAIHEQRLLKSNQWKLLLKSFGNTLNSNRCLTIHHIQIICSVLLKKRRWPKITWSYCTRSRRATGVNFQLCSRVHLLRILSLFICSHWRIYQIITLCCFVLTICYRLHSLKCLRWSIC